uniref:Uncharacterized protein n=1 Tax=Rhizophora mucronata TaxID=61149 RepID=A0A2P2N6Z4_RHIMU
MTFFAINSFKLKALQYSYLFVYF